jgi:predicted nucleic acid-binding protein
MDTGLSEKPRTSAQPAAFIDTSVFHAYLIGKNGASRLFEGVAQDHLRLVVNPVVLQELASLPQVQASPGLLAAMSERLKLEIIPLDMDRGQQLLERAKVLRNRLAHSSDILIAASALDCDYLVTYDRTLKELIEGDKPRVMTPEEFTSLLANA